MARILTPTQLDQYRDEGFVVLAALIEAPLLRRMRDALAELVEKSRRIQTHDEVYDLEPGHTADRPRVRRIKKPHVVHPVFRELLDHPGLKAATQDLLGENVRLYNSKLNVKAPEYGSPVEWHQDWAFYPHTNDDVTAAGVMLDDTSVENGAMYVLPGTHRGPTFDHHGSDGRFCGAMDPDACGLDFRSALACEGPAGSVSFHHARTVHGSAQNVSDRPRSLLLYELTAADAYPLMNLSNAGYEEFRARMVYGSECFIPRVVPAPIRLPLPPALHQGSIYENQTAGKRYFGFVDAGGRKSVTS
jgi:phytanoyl-CoA hydroxylase